MPIVDPNGAPVVTPEKRAERVQLMAGAIGGMASSMMNMWAAQNGRAPQDVEIANILAVTVSIAEQTLEQM